MGLIEIVDTDYTQVVTQQNLHIHCHGRIVLFVCLSETFQLKLLRHSLGVAYHGSSLVCYSFTYLEYKSACRVVYAISLSHISDIRESDMEFLTV